MVRKYKGWNISKHHTSPMAGVYWRWKASSYGRSVYADTLDGLKELIRKEMEL